jgi:D-glycero-D-manno-heptose 1,7-bisphosphate phosphatase
MKLIILDRDGVINYDSDQFIKSPQEWRPIEGSLEAIALLNQFGWRVVVATNQSGVGRGLFDMDTLAAIHEKMHRSLAQTGGRIDAIFFCPHAADSKCACRKPKPGMLLEIASRFNVDLADVPVVGDSLRDLQAADAAGAQPVLVRTGKGTRTEADPALPRGARIYDNLAAMVRALTVIAD